MNSKERIKAAMRGEKVDRIPLMCQFSLGYLAQYNDMDKIEYWYTPHGLAESYIRGAKKYHFDGILVSISGRNPKEYEKIKEVQDNDDGSKLVTFHSGRQHIVPHNDFPYDTKQEKSTKPSYIEEVSLEDVHLPMSREELPEYAFNILEEVLEREKENLSIHGEVETAFAYYLQLFDSWGSGLMSLLDDEEKALTLMERINKHVIMLAVSQCELGIDALKLSSPFAGAGFISREMYKKFVLPFEKEVIGTVHERFGIPCYIHTCGAIGDRLDLMVETGTDGLECLDPKPLGTVDLEEAIQKIGDKVFIKGNLDSVNELRQQTPEEIKQIVHRRLEIGAKCQRGYILSTACSIAPDVPEENVCLLHECMI